ncbi:hypothetical protein E1301_Tti024201 [Triplophysa tibetana]|uniref:Uncharacterized protein n=1 Tax=Triplophysa tibetana TaxID=1572043 RepID=A0A5A9P4U3_9TELE|nr:hypothetical protein E1301_Tti024201 [Triplophysa tibetana]
MLAQPYLWPTLAYLPERDLSAFLSPPISPSGLFREGLCAFQAQFEDSKKQAETLRGSMPQRFNAPGPSTANVGLNVSLPGATDQKTSISSSTETLSLGNAENMCTA